MVALAVACGGPPTRTARPAGEPRAARDPDPGSAPDPEPVATRGVPHRVLHFTFDDGPHRFHTSQLLTVLERYDVRATFFVVTRTLEEERYRARAVRDVRRMVADGHTIGLHGHDHTGFRRLSDAALTDQLQRGVELVRDATDRTPTLVRPPYGARDERTDRVVAGLGFRQVMWTMTPEIPRHDEEEAIVAQFREQLASRERESDPGGVVLLHDTRPWVVTAFPRLMRHLRRRNCQHLERGEELWLVVPSLEELTLDDAEVEARQAALRERLAPRCR